jgi:hypothetical protein
LCNLPAYIFKNINVYSYAESYASKDPEETANDDQLVDDTDSDGSQSDTSTDSSDDDI